MSLLLVCSLLSRDQCARSTNCNPAVLPQSSWGVAGQIGAVIAVYNESSHAPNEAGKRNCSLQ